MELTLSAPRTIVAALSLAMVLLAATAGSTRMAERNGGADGSVQAAAAMRYPGEAFDARIGHLQQRLRESSGDEAALAELGGLYLQKARETADVAYYDRAGRALQQALALEPDDPVALASAGVLALAQHRFQQALELGEQARRLNPDAAAVYGIIGDALVELGRYPEAFDAFEEMVRRRPDLSSYARISYARELSGDVAGAIDAMRTAARSGGAGESGAWTWHQLGMLLWNYRGDAAAAEQSFRTALLAYPDYPPALAGLARLAAAAGRSEEAIGLAQRAATLLPVPEHVTLLADLLQAAGRPDEAAQQVELVRAIDRLYRESGMQTDVEAAQFEADLGERLDYALAAAEEGYRQRPSVKGADVLAWALLANGRVEEAAGRMREALRLGWRDPLVLYHAGKIAAAAGDDPGAVRYLSAALSENPAFSLRYAEDARETVSRLRERGQR